MNNPAPAARTGKRIRRLVDLYWSIATAREMDRAEMELVQQGMAFFHVSGAGHEASAALARHLHEDDWLHLHYRDKALALARGIPIDEFFGGLLARHGSHSMGRQMSAHFSHAKARILSLVGPVGNNALQAVGVAAAVIDQCGHPIVVCSVGDGTTQEGEFLEAVAEAVRRRVPVLFLIHDNHYSISTITKGQTFFDLPTREASEFYGLTLHRVPGEDCEAADALFAGLVSAMRRDRLPRIAILCAERLSDHTNADDQSRYRDATEITHGAEKRDPIPSLENRLIDLGLEPSEIASIRDSIKIRVREAVDCALERQDPVASFNAKAPLPKEQFARSEYRGDQSRPRLTMREAINAVLRHRLTSDNRVFLFGQDIEDPKGDVFGVTQGLSTAFPNRVKNAPLAESTIVGTCIGRSLAGQRPVAFIQFADFLPLAYNQIASELGSILWRTDGAWRCPVILMITCGGYRPGLGPFHSQTLESVAAHVPGVDVVMPSSAADAAGLLNAAFDSERPTLFFYPKSCLNLSDRSTSADVERQHVPLGKARSLRSGRDLTLVTWGNTIAQALRAADNLASADISVDVLDLRSISPWDEDAVVTSAERTGRLVVVHEDNMTCGFGAEVIATVCEKAKHPIRSRRIARSDTYVPFHFGNQLEVLPSFKRILEVCSDLADVDVTWERQTEDGTSGSFIRAIGSGPADESVDVVRLNVNPGDTVVQGQIVAEVEATKSVVEVVATIAGTVAELCVREGDRVLVGAPLLRLTPQTVSAVKRFPKTDEDHGVPRLRRREAATNASHFRVHRHRSGPSAKVESPENGRQATFNQQDGGTTKMNIAGFFLKPTAVLGSRSVETASIAAEIPGWTPEDAVKRTGIATRRWACNGDDVVSMAIQAAQKLLQSLSGAAPPITAVICSTTTPREASPSVACQVATAMSSLGCLSENYFAFDFNAACSGFLYGLRIAADIQRRATNGSVLLITSEVASHMLDPADAATVFLFGDASTATLVTGEPIKEVKRCIAYAAPVCASLPDPDTAIHLPCLGTAKYLRMDGIAVARTAYKGMSKAVRRAAEESQLKIADLANLVPHPGSQRILQNVANDLGLPVSRVLTTLADTGNTSSSSIPLALEHFWEQLPAAQPFAMTAFGAGFTAAATIATAIKK